MVTLHHRIIQRPFFKDIQFCYSVDPLKRNQDAIINTCIRRILRFNPMSVSHAYSIQEDKINKICHSFSSLTSVLLKCSEDRQDPYHQDVRRYRTSDKLTLGESLTPHSIYLWHQVTVDHSKEEPVSISRTLITKCFRICFPYCCALILLYWR